MTAILAAWDESLCEHLYQQLLEADCEDVRVAERLAELVPLLVESKDAVVVLGGPWPQLQSYLRVAVRARATAILVFQECAASDEDAREALETGASAVLHEDISTSSLKSAVAASRAGLIVLDRLFDARRESLNPDLPQGRSHGGRRRLTMREREILSLVASGVSNKGIARILGVSANTVKSHVVATFEKLNAATRAEAVSEAMRRGELSL